MKTIKIGFLKMQLTSQINLFGLGAFVGDALILSDLHIGSANEATSFHNKCLREQFQLNIVMNKHKHSMLILNGDIKHGFGKLTNFEYKSLSSFVKLAKKHFQNIVFIKGNHDTFIGSISKSMGIKVTEELIISRNLIVHGDKIIENIPTNIKTLIIGHEHPAITFKKGAKVENYKCFLYGKWKKYSLLVLPAIGSLAQNKNILKEELLSPYLKEDISNFEVLVTADQIYDFGTIKELKKAL